VKVIDLVQDFTTNCMDQLQENWFQFTNWLIDQLEVQVQNLRLDTNRNAEYNAVVDLRDQVAPIVQEFLRPALLDIRNIKKRLDIACKSAPTEIGRNATTMDIGSEDENDGPLLKDMLSEYYSQWEHSKAGPGVWVKEACDFILGREDTPNKEAPTCKIFVPKEFGKIDLKKFLEVIYDFPYPTKVAPLLMVDFAIEIGRKEHVGYVVKFRLSTVGVVDKHSFDELVNKNAYQIIKAIGMGLPGWTVNVNKTEKGSKSQNKSKSGKPSAESTIDDQRVSQFEQSSQGGNPHQGKPKIKPLGMSEGRIYYDDYGQYEILGGAKHYLSQSSEFAPNPTPPPDQHINNNRGRGGGRGQRGYRSRGRGNY